MTVRTGARYETTTKQTYGIIVSGNADATLDVSGGDMFVDGEIALDVRPAGTFIFVR